MTSEREPPSASSDASAEERLEEQLRFERLVSDLSATFVSLPADGIDSEVERWLARLVDHLGVERSSIAQLSDDRTRLSITHSYAVPGYPPAHDIKLDQDFGWYAKRLREGKIFRFERLPDDLPPEAEAERTYVLQEGFKSHLVIPLAVGGTLVGLLAFGAFRTFRTWPDGLVERLRLAAEVFGNALARKRAQERLEERLRFEAVLADLSAAFIALPAEQVDAQIGRWLRRLGEALEVDRVSVARFTGDGAVHVTHSYQAAGVPEPPKALHEFPWYLAQVRQGRPVTLRRLPDDLPAEASVEAEYCRQAGIRSHLAIPVTIGSSLRGIIGFTSFRGELGWPDDLVGRLRLAGEILGGAVRHGEADLALRRSEERLRRLLETAPEGVVLVAADGTTMWVNEQVRRLFGYRPEELLERPAEMLVPHRFRSVHARLREGLAVKPPGHRPERPLELGGLRKDGTEFPAEYHLSSVEMANGTLVAYHIRDITELKHAEEAAQRHRDELAHVARVAALGELATGLAHELNQPLAAIVANAQAARRLLGRGETLDLDEILHDVAGDATRAGEIIRRLRALLRRGEPAMSALDIGEVIRGVEPLARVDARRHDAALILELTPELPTVSGDPIQLQQVLLNLIRNGVEAMQDITAPARQVVVTATHGGGDEVVVAVRDAGPLVDEDVFGRLFNPFYTTKPEGLGMGLSISRSIVEAHGGRLWATRNPDRGLTLCFTVRCAERRSIPANPGGGAHRPEPA